MFRGSKTLRVSGNTSNFFYSSSNFIFSLISSPVSEVVAGSVIGLASLLVSEVFGFARLGFYCFFDLLTSNFSSACFLNFEAIGPSLLLMEFWDLWLCSFDLLVVTVTGVVPDFGAFEKPECCFKSNVDSSMSDVLSLVDFCLSL